MNGSLYFNDVASVVIQWPPGWIVDNLVLEPVAEVEVELEAVPIQKAAVIVEVVKSDQQIQTYTVHVPKGSSLLTALELLRQKKADFT